MKSKHHIDIQAAVGCWLCCWCLSSLAQQRISNPAQPTPEEVCRSQDRNFHVEAGEDAGDYTVISSIEFGYRGLQVVGDLNKYQSDLNYKAGPRLFDTSFLMRSKDGKGGLFDTLLVTSTGWGADP